MSPGLGKFALCSRDISQAADQLLCQFRFTSWHGEFQIAQLSPNCLYAYNGVVQTALGGNDKKES
jgi:hypothetical protein